MPSAVGSEFNDDIKKALQQRQQNLGQAPSYGSGDAMTSAAANETAGPFTGSAGLNYDAAALQQRMNGMRQPKPAPSQKKQEKVGETYPATDPGQNY